MSPSENAVNPSKEELDAEQFLIRITVVNKYRVAGSNVVRGGSAGAEGCQAICEIYFTGRSSLVI